MLKNILITLGLAAMMAVPAFSQGEDKGGPKVKIGGYVGEQIDLCNSGMIMSRNVDELVEPFRHKDDTKSWSTEFIGKWMLGAMDMYRYNGDPALLAKIEEGIRDLVATQEADGFIGSYSPEARLKRWDIWGRKYTALALLSYYDLTGDKSILESAARSIDCLINDLEERNIDIASTGYYYGMASCSVLEPVVWLYRETGSGKYLEFAERIVESIEREGSSRLITKALADVPVSARSAFPGKWWSFENGMKAYEMMSCYEGLVELGEVTEREEYLQAARKTAESIVRDEINIAGSGAAFECWYMGRERQTIPAYHTMETCVTFTWMQFCARLLAKTGDAFYADQFERTMYNALMASMKADGSEISKYSPLEGHRSAGEEQCGMHINCCNANGPRGFALIPRTALTFNDNVASLNLYLPLKAKFRAGRADVGVKVETAYPQNGNVRISFYPAAPVEFTLALRVPEWTGGLFDVSVNGEPQTCPVEKGYMALNRKWRDGDVVGIEMDIRTRLVEQNNMQAVTRGPLVFARDSRFGDGYVDESAVIQADENGFIDAEPVLPDGSFCWLDLQVPMVLGANLEDPDEKSVKLIHFCDFASAGNDWDKNGRYRVWIPKTLHVMSEPYHRY
ncbi:MAG: beta-L-arabinofuranosidase domain-containing protein [Candidatus Cryptobacteroides sp.]